LRIGFRDSPVCRAISRIETSSRRCQRRITLNNASLSLSDAPPDRLVEELKGDDAIAEADTLPLTIPNQPGVDYNAHVIEAILTKIAPALGWR
jgi:hypothetical protein